jgi:isopenicillin-N epimerase
MHVSWGYHPDRRQPDVVDQFGTTPRLRFYEFEGFRDPCAWIAVKTAIEFQEELGLERIQARNAELVAQVRSRLDGVAGLERITPMHPELHGFITAYRMPPGATGPDWQRQLWERHRIELAFPERPSYWILRVSTHFYTTSEEIDLLGRAFTEMHLSGAGH